MPNERFIFLVGSYLAKTDQWKWQVRTRYQEKALLIVEAFLLPNTVIFLCSCSHAWSLHYDEMGLGAGRGKKSISYLSGQLPHCLAVPPPFPSPFCCLVLKFCITEIPHRPKECMKTTQKPSGPLPQRTRHRPLQKRVEDLRTKGWTFVREWRRYLVGGMGERSLWITCFWWAERLRENMHSRERVQPHLCGRHVPAQPEWQHTWASHLEAGRRNLTLALIQSRDCLVSVQLLIVLPSVAAAERRCLSTAFVGVYASMMTLTEKKPLLH